MKQSDIDRFLNKVTKTDGCWIWNAATCHPRTHPRPYGQFYFKGKTIVAHRVSYLLFRGNIEDSSLDVCHKCDNALCVNPSHLFLGTRKENMQDCLKKGRYYDQCHDVKLGGKTKLTKEQVLKIRELKDLTNEDLGNMFGVHRETIKNIRSGRTWAKILPKKDDVNFARIASS